MKDTLYDRNAYYQTDGRASRLSSLLNPLLWLLDAEKCSSFLRATRLRVGARVLDVGAGDGKFLRFLQDRGFEVAGTTASLTSQKAAKELYGVSLSFDLDLTGSIAQQAYDAVCYWHVYEHLEKPELHHKAWNGLLKDQGVLMIEVPAIEGIGAKLSYSSWLGSDDIHHINHRKTSEIIEAARAAGLKLFRKEAFSLKFSYVFLWSALLGGVFGSRLYGFDQIMQLLKQPGKELRRAPLKTLNAVCSVLYFSPLILLLMLWGVLTDRGEIVRLYFRK